MSEFYQGEVPPLSTQEQLAADLEVVRRVAAKHDLAYVALGDHEADDGDTIVRGDE